MAYTVRVSILKFIDIRMSTRYKEKNEQMRIIHSMKCSILTSSLLFFIKISYTDRL